MFGTEINGQTVEGIMDTLDHGILYIQNVSYLPENTQEKLADFLLSKSFLRKKGKKRVYKDIRIILSSIPSQKEQMCEILESRIPVVCNIPSFSERNEDEKKELILHFFYEEEECLGKNISISNKLLYSLIRETYNNNLSLFVQMLMLILIMRTWIYMYFIYLIICYQQLRYPVMKKNVCR